ncbi:MAG: PAS domain-containing protein [Proteobacteria bacterium]|nr:PAS domain-containing protein [Pseudomonadota bacterium]
MDDSTQNKNADLMKTPGSLIVRDLSGKIYLWSSVAEEKYGWSSSKAIGSVSHDILNTVFPEPLEIINNELLSRGVWKGELIHTRVDGSRVKVKSSWHLYRDEKGDLCTVLEINDNFFSVDPTNAHLSSNFFSRLKRIAIFLEQKKRWWLTPLIVFVVLLFAFLNFTMPGKSFFEQVDHLQSSGTLE